MVRPRRLAVLSALLLAAPLSQALAGPAHAAGGPEITVSDITMGEPYPGEAATPFTVTLASPAETELTVPWTFWRGTPAREQYSVHETGQLTFEPGETSKQLSFPLAYDPYDTKKPWYYTVRLDPGWDTGADTDRYGVATIYDTTRDGEFSCTATLYEAVLPVAPWPFSGMVGGTDCPAGNRHDEGWSSSDGRVTVERSTMEVVRYADNSVYTRPADGDGGEAHVSLGGVTWRIAPGVVLRAASITSDNRIVCTAVGDLPLMESSSSVTGLRINGAPPLGTITDEYVVDLGPAGRVVLNEHRDDSLVIAGGDQAGEPHRSLIQSAITVYQSPLTVTWLAMTHTGQMFGNPCNS